MKNKSSLRRWLIVVACLFGALLCAAYALADTPIKDLNVSGSSSKISSGTFSIQTGVIFQALSGSTIDLSAATTVKVGTLTTATNGNAIVDPNGTGAIELLASTYIGTTATTPTAFLHVAAGVAAAGGAPIKLTSGVLLTTPESGTFNYDGNFYYGTNSTPTRQRFSMDAATVAIAALDINWSLGASFSKTLGANSTITFSNTVDGRTIVVAITNTGANYTLAWTGVTWSGGTTPTQTVGVKTDVYTFTKIGSVIYGSVVQNF